MLRLMLVNQLEERHGIRTAFRPILTISGGERSDSYFDWTMRGYDVCLVSGGDLTVQGNLALDNPHPGPKQAAQRTLYDGFENVEIVQGLLISKLEAGCPLAEAGAQEGDLIVACNGSPLAVEEDIQPAEGAAAEVQLYQGFELQSLSAKAKGGKWATGATFIDRNSVDLVKGEFGPRFIQALIVLGDLTVNGAITDKTGNSLAALLVQGNLKAYSVVQSMTDMFVGKDATIEDLAICTDELSGTGITVRGTLRARFVAGAANQMNAKQLQADLVDHDERRGTYSRAGKKVSAKNGRVDEELLKSILKKLAPPKA